MTLPAVAYLDEVYRRTGVAMTIETAKALGAAPDRDAREMVLTYRGLGYAPSAAAIFLKTYYLLEYEPIEGEE